VKRIREVLSVTNVGLKNGCYDGTHAITFVLKKGNFTGGETGGEKVKNAKPQGRKFLRGTPQKIYSKKKGGERKRARNTFRENIAEKNETRGPRREKSGENSKGGGQLKVHGGGNTIKKRGG